MTTTYTFTESNSDTGISFDYPAMTLNEAIEFFRSDAESLISLIVDLNSRKNETFFYCEE